MTGRWVSEPMVRHSRFCFKIAYIWLLHGVLQQAVLHSGSFKGIPHASGHRYVDFNLVNLKLSAANCVLYKQHTIQQETECVQPVKSSHAILFLPLQFSTHMKGGYFR